MEFLIKINRFIESNQTPSKLFVLFILLLLLIQVSNKNLPYPTGDGPEYVLTTEALYNHNSADLRKTDVSSFKYHSCKIKPWNEVNRNYLFDSIGAFVNASDSLKYLSSYYGSFYVDLKGSVYVHHFIFYSILNVPMRYIMHWSNNDPMLGFEYTNILLIITTCMFLIFYDKKSFWTSLIITLLFFFNGAFWYVNWIHTEVMTACFAAISIFLLYKSKYYWSIFFMSLAALQNQPLGILVLMMVMHTIYIEKFTLRSFILSAISSIIVLWPSMFYYYHYRIASLISYGNYLSADNISFERFIGFFFDLNQGVIIALPIIMPVYVIIIIYLNAKNALNRKLNLLLLFIPIGMLLITYVACMINNWIYGMGVINRYAVWISAIISMHFFFICSGLNFKNIYKFPLFFIIIISQIWTVFYFEKDNLYDWMDKGHTKPAQWILNSFPSLYNPDPNIFIIRTRKNYKNVMDPNNSPVIHFNKKLEIMKVAIHKDKLQLLKGYGIKEIRIKEIETKNKFIFGWTYLNTNDFAEINPIYSSRFKTCIEDSLIQMQINFIKTDSNWLQMIRKKSIELNMPLDSILKMDAKYILDLKNNE